MAPLRVVKKYSGNKAVESNRSRKGIHGQSIRVVMHVKVLIPIVYGDSEDFLLSHKLDKHVHAPVTPLRADVESVLSAEGSEVFIDERSESAFSDHWYLKVSQELEEKALTVDY